MFQLNRPDEADDIEVFVVGSRQWRIVDPARADEGEQPLVGFVEEHGEEFEAIPAADPDSRATFDTLDDAVEALVDPESGG
jgi:hypothetical protein